MIFNGKIKYKQRDDPRVKEIRSCVTLQTLNNDINRNVFSVLTKQ